MSKTITVAIADLNVATGEDILITHALGSCIGICLYDSALRIAGMAHIMLPTKTGNPKFNQPMKFADSAIPELIRRMEMRGAGKTRLTAKIAGGAKMFAIAGNSDITNIGARNIVAVKAVLQSLRIPVIAEDCGKDFGRTQLFDAKTGTMTIRSALKGEWSM